MRISDWSSDVCSSDLATGAYSAAVGSSASATQSNSTALGTYALADGEFSTALGARSEATGKSATAVGSWVDRDGDNIIDGDEVVLASGTNSSAFGSGAQATADDKLGRASCREKGWQSV